MFKKLMTRSLLAVAIATALFGTAAEAQADPVAASGATQGNLTVRQVDDGAALSAAPTTRDDDVSIQATYTFNRAQTEQIYEWARNGATAAITAFCVAIAPGWLKGLCPFFAGVVISYVPKTPPAGRCLQAYSKFGIPPVGLRYVAC